MNERLDRQDDKKDATRLGRFEVNLNPDWQISVVFGIGFRIKPSSILQYRLARRSPSD
jgi:hypothetical protein